MEADEQRIKREKELVERQAELAKELVDRNLTTVHEYLLEAQSRTKQIQDHMKEAQLLERFWQRLYPNYLNGEYAAALKVLMEHENAIPLLHHNQARLIKELRSECQEAAADTAKTFVRNFPDAVRDAGIDIDSESRDPKYFFKQGFIEVAINDRTYTAKITPRDGKPIELGLDIEPVVKELNKEIKRLFERPFNANTFLRLLFNAYSAVIRADDNRRDGDMVPIRRITHRLSKNSKNFSSDLFNIDLGKLLQLSHLEFKGRKMQLNNTRNPREGMLIHGHELGGYYGFIGFQ